MLHVEEPYMISWQWQIIFENWLYILPKYGTLGLQHVRDTHLIFVFIKTLHLFGKIESVR